MKLTPPERFKTNADTRIQLIRFIRFIKSRIIKPTRKGWFYSFSFLEKCLYSRSDCLRYKQAKPL